MKCFWIFFHKWGKWGDSQTLSNCYIPAAQFRYCEKCNLMKVRQT